VVLDALESDSPVALRARADLKPAPQLSGSPVEQETERVASLVGGWLSNDVRAARLRGGLVDVAYGQIGEALRAATRDVPRFADTNSPLAVGGALLEGWRSGAESYGSNGAPYAEPEGRVATTERPSALVESMAKGSPDGLAMAQLLSAGARLQEFADGRAGLQLYALVELRHLPSGALESVKLVRSSGLEPFDAWVVDRARHGSLSASADGGTRVRPLRSVWRFDGIVLYRRKLSALDGGIGGAAVGMITMAALSALSTWNHETRPPPGEMPRPLGPRMPALVGRFDETNGSLDLIDLTNPTYTCTVRLIEAD
jgi:hypothetical protein